MVKYHIKLCGNFSPDCLLLILFIHLYLYFIILKNSDYFLIISDHQ